MSWGTKIIISFAVFMTGMMIMVFYVFNLKMDLVEDNYYEQEIKYQDHINTLKNSNDFSDKLMIKKEKENIYFQFPAEGSVPGGEIFFYRPSDAGKDFKLNIATKEDRSQEINTTNLTPGIWEIQVTWYSDNNKYFKEERVYID